MLNPTNLYKIPKPAKSRHDSEVETFIINSSKTGVGVTTSLTISATDVPRVPKERILILSFLAVKASPTGGASGVSSIQISLSPPEQYGVDNVLLPLESEGYNPVVLNIAKFKSWIGEIWLPENWGFSFSATWDAAAAHVLQAEAYGILIPLSNVNRLLR